MSFDVEKFKALTFSQQVAAFPSEKVKNDPVYQALKHSFIPHEPTHFQLSEKFWKNSCIFVRPFVYLLLRSQTLNALAPPKAGPGCGKHSCTLGSDMMPDVALVRSTAAGNVLAALVERKVAVSVLPPQTAHRSLLSLRPRASVSAVPTASARALATSGSAFASSTPSSASPCSRRGSSPT